MNERIQELAEQAGFKILTDGRIIPTLDHNGECGRDLQKFAKLIVRECIDIIEDEGSHEGGSIRSMEKIKQHFGVEE